MNTSTNDKILNKYYFVQQDKGVIYNISNSQDSDYCGISPGYDDKGIKDDGTLKEIFPYIELTYSTFKTVTDSDGNTTLEVDTTGNKKYLWLQNFIYEGDSYDGSKFSCTNNLHKDGCSTFIQRYVKSLENQIRDRIKAGYTASSLRNLYPNYLYEEEYETRIDGKRVKVTAVSDFDTLNILSDDEIGDLYKRLAKEEAEIAANNILNKNNQQVDTLNLTVKPI